MKKRNSEIMRPKAISIEDWNALSWDQQYTWHKENSSGTFYFRAILRMEFLYRKRLMPRLELPLVLLAEFRLEDLSAAKRYCPEDVWFRTKDSVAPNLPDDEDDAAWDRERQKINCFWFPQKPHDTARIRKGVAAWRAALTLGDI